jgi:hypothetical protein
MSIVITIEISGDAFSITTESEGGEAKHGMTRCANGWKGTRKHTEYRSNLDDVFDESADEIEEHLDQIESACMDIADVLVGS